MIPRYKPTYSFGDLWRSLLNSFSTDAAAALKTRLGEIYQCKHVFLFGDGKTAIAMLLGSMGKPGDVLTPAYNCIAVPQAISRAGYVPRFVDAVPGRLNVGPQEFLDAITPQVKAVMPVHLFGIPWEVDQFYSLYPQRNVPVMEDAAPALGARRNGKLLGSHSDAMILSFHWTKPISGEGGGALLINNEDLAAQVASQMGKISPAGNRYLLFLKSWWRKSITQTAVYGLTRIGHSVLFGERMFEVVPPEKELRGQQFSSISPFSAALVLRQLEGFEKNLQSRRFSANIYQQELSGCNQFILPYVPPDCEPSWIQYPLLVQDKNAFFHYMLGKGVDVTWSYRYSCPDTYGLGGFENSSKVAREIVSLPVWPGIHPEQARRIGKIAAAYRAR